MSRNSCYCGSGVSYATCCQPVITGKKQAQTAEQLMRARYSAFVVAETGFIFESTHPDHRDGYDHEGIKAWAENSEWLGLTIISTDNGNAEDVSGTVEFIARYKDRHGTIHTHHEQASFKKEEGTWYFTDGVTPKPQPIRSTKVGRNEPCPCGSGQKYKKCCGT